MPHLSTNRSKIDMATLNNFLAKGFFPRELPPPFNPDSFAAHAVGVALKLLLLCHLVEPWIRHNVTGHDPTFSEHFSTLSGESYLQIDPQQVWIFNSRTGEVVKKLTKVSQ